MPPENDPASNPFRRLTSDGAPEWQSPPQRQPIDPAARAESSTLLTPSNPSIAPDPGAPSAVDWPPVAETPSAAPTRWRRNVKMSAIVGMVVGAFALTAVGGGAWFAWRMLLGHEDRATAAYAPADAWAYVALNTDPTSRGWVDAWDLAKRAGIDDALRDLPKEGLSDSGEDPADWENLIKPAIGGEIGFVVWPGDDTAETAIPNVAAIVMIGDAEKANEAIEALLEDDSPESRSYRDIAYQTNDDGDVIGIVDGALVATGSDAAFEGIVDARLDGALDANASFTAAAERAADNPLLFVYMSGPAIADAVEDMPGFGALPMAAGGFGASLDTYKQLGVLTVTVRAQDNALRIVALTDGRPANFPTTPAGAAFASEVPASALFYSASADMYDTVWKPMLDSFDEMSNSGGLGMAPTSDDLAASLGADVKNGLLAHLRGAYAVSINVERNPDDMLGYAGELRLFSEVDDSNAVLNTLDEVADSLETSGMPIERTDTGLAAEAQGVSIDVSVADDTLRIVGGYGASNTSGSLADDESYKRAMNGMPENPTLTGYLALQQIVALIPEDEWAGMESDERAALEALGPLAWASAPDGDGTRTEVTLMIGE